VTVDLPRAAARPRHDDSDAMIHHTGDPEPNAASALRPPSAADPRDTIDESFDPSAGFVVGILLLVLASAAQGIYFLLEFPSTFIGRLAAATISFSCAAIAVRLSVRLGSLTAGVLIAEVTQLSLLVPHIAAVTPPYPMRWLLAGAVLMHIATVATTLLAASRSLRYSRIVVTPALLAIVLWVVEIVGPGIDSTRWDWPKQIGFVLANSVPTRLNPASASALTLYPSNPRGYFDDGDAPTPGSKSAFTI
jgi:hypothetical protein